MTKTISIVKRLAAGEPVTQEEAAAALAPLGEKIRLSWTDPEVRARRQAAMRGVSHGTGRSLSERFWDKVDKAGMIHPVLGQCWEWYGAHDQKHYGTLFDGISRIRRVTHISWFIHFGEWPPIRKQVCHRCDNTACIRPEHLFLGTPKQNTEDMVKKGRARGARGEDHAKAKLTWEQVREIRAIPQSYGSEKRIMELYGISRGALGALRRGDTWKE